MKAINRCWDREKHKAEEIQPTTDRMVRLVLSGKMTFKLTPEKEEIFYARSWENYPFQLEEADSEKTLWG